MAVLEVNSFTSYKMSDEEQLSTAVLTVGQEQLIQNDMAMAAQQLLNMDAPTEETIVDFSRNWASIQSRIRTLQELLDRSQRARETLERLASLSATGNSPT